MKLEGGHSLASFIAEHICSYIFVMNKEMQFNIKA